MYKKSLAKSPVFLISLMFITSFIILLNPILAVTPEQISNNHQLNYNKMVSQETSGGEVYKCSITPNDDYEDERALK